MKNYKLIAVDAPSFDALMDAMDRADRKGYMPDAMAAEWEAFDYRVHSPAGDPLCSALFADKDRAERLERSLCELLCILRDWEPDHASAEELASIRKARWTVGEQRLADQLNAMGKLTP